MEWNVLIWRIMAKTKWNLGVDVTGLASVRCLDSGLMLERG